MHSQVTSPEAPAAIGPYSHGIDTGSLVFCSGQLPVNDLGELAQGITEQTEQSLANVKAVLKAAGLDMSHVVKTTVFLADMGDFAAMNEVYGRWFAQPHPARSCVQVARLPKDALVEIEVIAQR